MASEPSVGNVVAFLNRFEELANEENFDLLADMIAETAFFRFSDGDYHGKDAIRAAFERTWRGDPSIRKSSFTISEVVVLTTDSHSATATYDWTWEGSQGDQHFLVHGRGTRILSYQDGRSDSPRTSQSCTGRLNRDLTFG